jgi:molybdopterin/thiamine biosynthesis adenylyltransferase
MLLQAAAARLGIPMVHGALAGFEGRVMTVLPGDAGVRALYGDAPGPKNRTARRPSWVFPP